MAYSDEEEEQGGFTLTGAEALSGAQVASTSASEMPCAITGLSSGLSGGALGYAFGFGGQLIKHRGKGRWKACTAEGWSSAKTFAIMGGLYAAVSCFSKRLRQKDDAWNGFASGCATGLVLSWGGKPMAMAQSCLGFGAFSFVFDYMGNKSPPAAAALTSSQPCPYPGRSCGRQWQGWPLQCTSCRLPLAVTQEEDSKPAPLQQLLTHSCFAEPLLTPAALWLQPVHSAFAAKCNAIFQNTRMR